MSDQEASETPTIPNVPCDGDPNCGGQIAVLFLGTGERMCAHCAADRLHVVITNHRSDVPAAPVPGEDGDPEVEFSSP